MKASLTQWWRKHILPKKSHPDGAHIRKGNIPTWYRWLPESVTHFYLWHSYLLNPIAAIHEWRGARNRVEEVIPQEVLDSLTLQDREALEGKELTKPSVGRQPDEFLVLDKVQYPARKILISCYHPSAGDDYFSPMMRDALIEYWEKSGFTGSVDTFTASNGVDIEFINMNY